MIYFWVTTWRDSVWVYLCLHILQVENGGAVRRLYDISAPSQLIAFVLRPYGFRRKYITLMMACRVSNTTKYCVLERCF